MSRYGVSLHLMDDENNRCFGMGKKVSVRNGQISGLKEATAKDSAILTDFEKPNLA